MVIVDIFLPQRTVMHLAIDRRHQLWVKAALPFFQYPEKSPSGR